MTRPPVVHFNIDDAQAAGDSWRFNCGPAAICAVTGMTIDQIRPHLGTFEAKGYTNPTLMFEILDRLKVRYRRVEGWPNFGLVRVQWHGPWTDPGVPWQARYRHTHWVASFRDPEKLLHIFDVNAICVGGWISFEQWSIKLVPWLLKQCEPMANGVWSTTHRLEVGR